MINFRQAISNFDYRAVTPRNDPTSILETQLCMLCLIALRLLEDFVVPLTPELFLDPIIRERLNAFW